MSEFNSGKDFKHKYLKYKNKYLEYKKRYSELLGGYINDYIWQGKLVDDPWLKELDKSKLDVWYEIPRYFNNDKANPKQSSKLIEEKNAIDITIRNRKYINLRKIQFIIKDSNKSNTWQENYDEGTYRWIDCTPERNNEINTKNFLNKLIPEKMTQNQPLYYIKSSILNTFIINNNKFRKFYIIPESDMYKNLYTL